MPAGAGVRMFLNEVFDKSQPARPWSVRLDLRRIRFIGISRRPNRMLALDAALRETIVYIAFFEEAHRGSCLCVVFLNDARLGLSLECGRREGKLRTISIILSLRPACRRLYSYS